MQSDAGVQPSLQHALHGLLTTLWSPAQRPAAQGWGWGCTCQLPSSQQALVRELDVAMQIEEDQLTKVAKQHWRGKPAGAPFDPEVVKRIYDQVRPSPWEQAAGLVVCTQLAGAAATLCACSNRHATSLCTQ